MIEITDKKINVQSIISEVSTDESGAIDIFIGTTRNSTSLKKVLKLEFESHESMAIKEFQKIVDQAKNKWEITKVAVSHRVGVVEIGEEAVVIAVSAPHRDAAFKACRYIIDTLKQTVPIWKKEYFEDGQVWVAAHP
ncbi:MAG: molybdenum cofactor biosynthesis protein MoaE [Cyclobacteriaceae bacterium]